VPPPGHETPSIAPDAYDAFMTARNAGRVSIGLVAASVTLVAADGGIYLWLIHHQDDGGPVWWFVAGLCVVIVLGLGSFLPALPRPVAALVGGVILLALGILGIFSVGLPLLVAGILMLAGAALRSRASAAPAA
jgi:hypothetical protein